VVADPDSIRRPLLPPELPWLYVVIPLPASYLLGHRMLEQPLPDILLMVLKNFLPFAIYGAAFHFVYRDLMPRLLATTASRALRGLMHVGVMLLTVVLIAPVVIWIVETFLDHPVQRLNFYVVSTIFSSACLFPSLALQSMRLRARSAEHRALVERQAALEAQLEALQARTDPHFLFNALNTVASLIQEDPALAERTLERLSDLFRYALESGQRRTVTLERELEMIRDYLALQSVRFGERLHTRLSVADEVATGIEVPPLLLQPLVENAIVHGASQKRGGTVEIEVRREHDRLIIDVCDDGPGPGGSSHAGAGTGVSTVAERLRLHYEERALLSLDRNPSGGFRARVSLPIAGVT
jgi:two-component system, LytTR family, sensor histidine kinase AlgZ